MGVEFDLGENLRVQADLLAVEQGYLGANHPLLFQALYAPPAWRLRQAHALGDLRAGERGIFLQQGQDAPVIGV
ncbi:hypothetical protein D9M71_268660 [compost metagenome]